MRCTLRSHFWQPSHSSIRMGSDLRVSTTTSEPRRRRHARHHDARATSWSSFDVACCSDRRQVLHPIFELEVVEVVDDAVVEGDVCLYRQRCCIEARHHEGLDDGVAAAMRARNHLRRRGKVQQFLCCDEAALAMNFIYRRAVCRGPAGELARRTDHNEPGALIAVACALIVALSVP